jgi:hypothetical protein
LQWLNGRPWRLMTWWDDFPCHIHAIHVNYGAVNVVYNSRTHAFESHQGGTIPAPPPSFGGWGSLPRPSSMSHKCKCDVFLWGSWLNGFLASRCSHGSDAGVWPIKRRIAKASPPAHRRRFFTRFQHFHLRVRVTHTSPNFHELGRPLQVAIFT